MHRVSITTAIV